MHPSRDAEAVISREIPTESNTSTACPGSSCFPDRLSIPDGNSRHPSDAVNDYFPQVLERFKWIGKSS
jgi:hypothetical protein